MNNMNENTAVVPKWLRTPATASPPDGIEGFIKCSNEYFEECADIDMRPTLTGYALAVGLPGPTSLLRLGQRVPELRYAISRCMMAVAHGYEEMIGSGNAAGPMFMLKNIPDYDPDEPVGAPSVQFFNDRKEILLQSNVVGAARSDSEYDNEDPLDTYLRLIKLRGQSCDASERSERASGNPSRLTQRRALTIITEGWDDE